MATTMSSLQVAEATGKRHDAIIRDIRKILDQGVNAHNFVAVEYTDKKGEKRPCFQLTKKGCLILASGYNAKLREQIIDRWEELETQAMGRDAMSLPAAAEASVTIERLNAALSDARETIKKLNDNHDKKSRMIAFLERISALEDPEHKAFCATADFQFVLDCMSRLMHLELVKADRVNGLEDRLDSLMRRMEESLTAFGLRLEGLERRVRTLERKGGAL